MIKKIAFLLIFIGFFPRLGKAEGYKIFPDNCSVPVPNINEWEKSYQSRIEFRLSDTSNVYLGLSVESSFYHNSASGEFVQVFSRHIPFISSKPSNFNERLFSDTMKALYAENKEKEKLNNLNKRSDPFLYVYWRIIKNPRNGNDMLDGDVNIWFLNSNGLCVFIQNEPIKIQFLSESLVDKKSKNVLVGIKYQIKDYYHILKADRREVVNLIKEEK
jgi:hypothetical protein